MQVTPLGGRRFLINGVDVGCSPVSISPTGMETCVLTIAGHSKRLEILRLSGGARIAVTLDGRTECFDLPLANSGADADAGGNAILSPMPGLVARIAAAPGQTVRKGDVLIVLEAMKMEHALTAPRNGTVAEVLCAERDQVSHGAQLLSLEPQDD